MQLAMEYLTAIVSVFVEYWAGEDLVSRPNWKVLILVRPPSNNEKYLAEQSTWIQEFVTHQSVSYRTAL